jgi:outer membrane lipoprotein-sorting protein
MTKSSIKRLILLLVLLVFSSVFMAGCGQQSTQDADGGSETGDRSEAVDSTATLDKIYAFYDKVQLGQTKAEVDTALGVTAKEPMTDVFQYTDANGNGVMIGLSSVFSQDGSSKVVFNKSVEGLEAYLITLPDDKRVTDEQAQSITEGMTYEETKAKLGGDGYELSSTQGFEGKPEIDRVWMKKGISMITVKFSGPDGTDVAKTIVDF